MSLGLFVFDRFLDNLIIQLSSGQRRIFFSRLGKDLKRINATRIKSNATPDGAAFAPRRPQTKLRGKRGKTRAMFQKLPKYIDATATDSGLELKFKGTAAHIADVHHFGLEDTPLKKRPRLRIRYTARELLGISDGDQAMIAERLIEQISKINI